MRSYIFIRKIGNSEPSMVMVFYLAWVSVICSAIPIAALPSEHRYVPSALEWAMLCGAGLMGTNERASLIVVINYLQLTFTVLLGVVLLHETPSWTAVGGCLLIYASTGGLLWANRAQPPPGPQAASATAEVPPDSSAHPLPLADVAEYDSESTLLAPEVRVASSELELVAAPANNGRERTSSEL